MTEIPLLDPEFREQLATLLSQAHHGGCDADEVLATARRISDGDVDSWVLEWVWTAGSTWAAANGALSSGQRHAAAVLYLRAAGYYAAALSQIAGSSERDRFAGAVAPPARCWERAVSCVPAAGRRIEIPYEGTSLPGYFFAAPGAVGRRRPLVIMHNGAHLPTSAMWGLGGAAAAAQGYHWLTFDGPGQQAALFDRGLFFRPDWEAVLGLCWTLSPSGRRPSGPDRGCRVRSGWLLATPSAGARAPTRGGRRGPGHRRCERRVDRCAHAIARADARRWRVCGVRPPGTGRPAVRPARGRSSLLARASLRVGGGLPGAGVRRGRALPPHR